MLSFSEDDTNYSLREKMSQNEKGAMIIAMLTTSTLGLVLPNVKEEYGEGKPFDAMLSLSYNYNKKLVPDIKFMQVSFNDKGVLTVNIPASIQILVEKIPTQLDDARTIVFNMEAKFQFNILELESGAEELEVKPKSIQFPVVKVFKEDSEQPLEGMLLQSLLNVQVGTFLQKMNPQYFPMNGFFNIPELQCLGIKLNDPSLLFYKGFVSFDVPFEKESAINETFCHDVELKFKEGPVKAFEQAGGDITKIDDWKDFVKRTIPSVLPTPNPENRPRKDEPKSKYKEGRRKSAGAGGYNNAEAKSDKADQTMNEDL